MSTIEGLLKEYESFVRQPWDRSLAGPQKVWFAIYEPTQKRRLRLRSPEFEMATKAAGHGWKLVDLTDTFAHWMAGNEYREAYFENPDYLDVALADYGDYLADLLTQALTTPDVDDNTIVALSGLASLFGLTRASALFERTASDIQGRLLVFFPGQRDGNNYRLLDARDGWNYLAIPIRATE